MAPQRLLGRAVKPHGPTSMSLCGLLENVNFWRMLCMKPPLLPRNPIITNRVFFIETFVTFLTAMTKTVKYQRRTRAGGPSSLCFLLAAAWPASEYSPQQPRTWGDGELSSPRSLLLWLMPAQGFPRIYTSSGPAQPTLEAGIVILALTTWGSQRHLVAVQ